LPYNLKLISPKTEAQTWWKSPLLMIMVSQSGRRVLNHLTCLFSADITSIAAADIIMIFLSMMMSTAPPKIQRRDDEGQSHSIDELYNTQQ